MEPVTNGLTRWTTKELLNEVFGRCAEDGPALRLLAGRVMGAQLAEIDRQPTPARSSIWSAGVARMTTHEVDPAISGAHSHDHLHRNKSTEKSVPHEHHHRHGADLQVDMQLNSHTHTASRADLPWERADAREADNGHGTEVIGTDDLPRLVGGAARHRMFMR